MTTLREGSKSITLLGYVLDPDDPRRPTRRSSRACRDKLEKSRDLPLLTEPARRAMGHDRPRR